MSRHFAKSRRDFLRLATTTLSLTVAAKACRVSAADFVPSRESEIIVSKGSYQSQGKTIGVERYEPKNPGKYPAVLVVHGSGGLILGGPSFRETARKLAQNGYVAYVAHYFDLTNTMIADLETMEKNFALWLKALADGVTYLAGQANVDAERLGLVGFSLGGFLSVSLSVFDYRIQAVADYFGGIPGPLANEVKTFPPLLILHGDADLIVPVAEAKRLEALCKEKKSVHEIKIYKGLGHGFRGEDGEDAAKRVVSFLDIHVKAGHPPRPRRVTAEIPSKEAITQAVKTALESKKADVRNGH